MTGCHRKNIASDRYVFIIRLDVSIMIVNSCFGARDGCVPTVVIKNIIFKKRAIQTRHIETLRVGYRRDRGIRVIIRED